MDGVAAGVLLIHCLMSNKIHDRLKLGLMQVAIFRQCYDSRYLAGIVEFLRLEKVRLQQAAHDRIAKKGKQLRTARSANTPGIVCAFAGI